jgi:hypothetical protein
LKKPFTRSNRCERQQKRAGRVCDDPWLTACQHCDVSAPHGVADENRRTAIKNEIRQRYRLRSVSVFLSSKASLPHNYRVSASISQRRAVNPGAHTTHSLQAGLPNYNNEDAFSNYLHHCARVMSLVDSGGFEHRRERAVQYWSLGRYGTRHGSSDSSKLRGANGWFARQLAVLSRARYPVTLTASTHLPPA